MTMEKR